MLASFLNKNVLVGVRKGVVIAEGIGRKGKLRVTVQFADGATEEMGYGCVQVQETCGPAAEFAPAEKLDLRGLSDFYGDRARISARW